MKKIFTLITFLFAYSLFAQTKVSGIVVDNSNEPIPYANIVFKGSQVGVVSNEDGRFYIESPETYTALIVSFVGFPDKEVKLPKLVNYDFKIVLKEGNALKEIKIFAGKTSKKSNPALDILRKIWERRRKNGLKMFKQYQYEKYEKVEFDMNTIDSAFMKNKIFKGMEFVFKNIDTSSVTGKTYLPIFINESLSDFYGDNEAKKTKEILKANKNSGLGNGDGVNMFVKDLYNDFDIYDNYLNFFDKSFVSPLSRTGIDVYNYVLTDTAFIDNKWCYNIVFYPRRKNELTFKGDFWVNDSTFAIKTINMAVTKSANINWVKDIYIEQEFEVLNDSVFLPTRDYMMSDFALRKKEESKGVYGKRTTLYRNFKFDEKKPEKFYKDEVNFIDNEVYSKTDEFWEESRFERLNKDEVAIYKMIDTLKTVKRFKQMYNLVSILGSGYIEIPKWHMDYGPIFSTVGFNEVEGWRLRAGGRTYFGPNDTWRLQGYTAYGFEDNKFKYGASGKWMVDKKNRIILSGGNRRDVEQIGASLTTTNDVLGRSYASSGLFTTGSNGKLTNINLTSIAVEMEPVKNLTLQLGFTYRTLESASDTFSLNYYTDDTFTTTASEVKQSEINLQVEYTPKRKTIGYGVERREVDSPYSRFFINYSQGFKGLIDSDFDYQKIQLYYKQPVIIGALGRSNFTMELGKTFGQIPLGLMSVVPGNQTYFIIQNTFSNLNFYEFVADEYATFQWEHNFNGKVFARIPGLRKLNLREIVGVRGVYGTISDENRAINASGLVYNAPEKPYWEYSAGIGNIFKVFRLDFAWRGNYRNLPDTDNFTIKGSFGFYF
ncbi:MAG: carboxypeptidase-like regulatory domain-containing protein [Flavobacterium sp.]|nr:carboxypeptidase-like regulatory domain-containing protein [Flavobacterium sp.]MBP8156864.1 carboxypeptidase-like regulatory domain-containing protein [Flavobacterium sp.]